MNTVASRDLRNHTRQVLDQVAAGVTVTVTVNGEPVAQITRPAIARRTSLRRVEVTELIARQQLDPALDADMAWISSDTTDDLDPLR